MHRRYRRFEISKRGGGKRTILAPIPELMDLQRRFAAKLAQCYDPKPCVHGFVVNRSIVSNAMIHSRARVLLNVDLKDFFPSIHIGRVIGLFRSKPFETAKPAAVVLAQLCCYDGKLPQGAPTSPIVANLICRRLDTELSRLAREHQCRYSRYADDLTFSTKRAELPPVLHHLSSEGKLVVGEALASLILQHKFQINPEKVRVQFKHERQIVTGLKINRFPNVSKKFLSQVRAMLHAWKKFDLSSAQDEFVKKYAYGHRAPYRGKPSFREIVKGKIAFLGMVRGKRSHVYLTLARTLRTLDPELVKYWDLDTDEERIRKSLCVLECSENQGTGFALKGFGLITCEHVITGKAECFRNVSPFLKKPVSILIKDAVLDLAICSVDLPELTELEPAETQVKEGDTVTVLGFPNFSLGSSGTVVEANVIGWRIRSSVPRILIDTPIVKGTSGGPVLNSEGKVVGVAALGVAGNHEINDIESGFIPIDQLKRLHQTT